MRWNCSDEPVRLKTTDLGGPVLDLLEPQEQLVRMPILAHRKAGTLSQRDWDRFIRARRAGKAGGSGKPMSDRTVEYDLRLLLAVLNWAAKSRDEEGRLLLESNPLRGLKLPKEKNPRRVVLTQAEYAALLRVSAEVDWRFRVALVLAHETGHRIGAIRQLRWSDIDIDIEHRTIWWRGEHEKTGYEHRTPVTAEALGALEEARRRNPGIGDTPSPTERPGRPRTAGPRRRKMWPCGRLRRDTRAQPRRARECASAFAAIAC